MPLTHYRSSPGLAVAACGLRGLALRFSINRRLVTCPDCIKRRGNGIDWNKRTANLSAVLRFRPPDAYQP